MLATASTSPPTESRLAEFGGPSEVARRLRADEGLLLRSGPFVLRIHTRLAEVATAVSQLYADHRVADVASFVDFDVEVWRPWWRRGPWAQVQFAFEGQTPFNALPGPQGLPLLEWGLNWCASVLCHQYLVLHAAVLERNGRAMLLPAPSGSGKSTLCAALAFRGWRLLSDELALFRPADGRIQPWPRPISLKNASIPAFRRFVPQAVVGSLVHDTSKGTVAHVRPPREAVDAGRDAVPPGAVLMPRFVAGSGFSLTELDPAEAFMALVENAFNYDVFGREGFDLLCSAIDGSRCATLQYGGDLDAAVATLNAWADGMPALQPT